MKLNVSLKILLVLLTASFIGLVGWSIRDKTVHEGDRAPDFNLHSDQGRTVTPNHFGGKVLVLNFWAAWCAPCREETPSLSAFQRKYKDQGVVVFAVSVDKSEQLYQRFIQRFHVPFDTYRDPSADLSTLYGTFQYPETYIIKDGRVVRKYPLGVNWMSDDVTQYVQSLL